MGICEVSKPLVTYFAIFNGSFDALDSFPPRDSFKTMSENKSSTHCLLYDATSTGMRNSIKTQIAYQCRTDATLQLRGPDPGELGP